MWLAAFRVEFAPQAVVELERDDDLRPNSLLQHTIVTLPVMFPPAQHADESPSPSPHR
jgi:hypothetical protein